MPGQAGVGAPRGGAAAGRSGRSASARVLTADLLSLPVSSSRLLQRPGDGPVVGRHVAARVMASPPIRHLCVPRTLSMSRDQAGIRDSALGSAGAAGSAGEWRRSRSPGTWRRLPARTPGTSCRTTASTSSAARARPRPEARKYHGDELRRHPGLARPGRSATRRTPHPDARRRLPRRRRPPRPHPRRSSLVLAEGCRPHLVKQAAPAARERRLRPRSRRRTPEGLEVGYLGWKRLERCGAG